MLVDALPVSAPVIVPEMYKLVTVALVPVAFTQVMLLLLVDDAVSDRIWADDVAYRLPDTCVGRLELVM